MLRATAFALTRTPLSPAQTVSETGSGTVIRHGCLQIVCATAVHPASAAMPPPMTPEAAAEAAALGASAGRRLSLGTPPVAVAAYAAAGLIEWDAALIMAVATTIDGYLGARGARLIRMDHLRLGITGVGLVMTALFFAL